MSRRLGLVLPSHGGQALPGTAPVRKTEMHTVLPASVGVPFYDWESALLPAKQGHQMGCRTGVELRFTTQQCFGISTSQMFHGIYLS